MMRTSSWGTIREPPHPAEFYPMATNVTSVLPFSVQSCIPVIAVGQVGNLFRNPTVTGKAAKSSHALEK
jgi:hypothetical protein